MAWRGRLGVAAAGILRMGNVGGPGLAIAHSHTARAISTLKSPPRISRLEVIPGTPYQLLPDERGCEGIYLCLHASERTQKHPQAERFTAES
jgi:hypothetical protein